ncbi:RadC [Enterobacter ludwigii]|uniref:UPF0758 protein EcWSU1_00102 n=2 Tax=Enterobacter ludwigii TaxID=299767 RepID=G8LFQ8_9ENTR|nr:RadC [Enterobacter ludwigii]
MGVERRGWLWQHDGKSKETGMEETELLLPREKMLRYGVTLLKDDELLALFLRTGTPGKTVFTLAKELIDHFGSLYGLLTADLTEFRHVEGIGVAKFAQLRGIAELARRFYDVRMEEEDPILTPDMTRVFLQSQLSDLEREIFMVIFLDNRNRVLKHSRLFSGTLSHVEVHPREIVREAIKVNAAGVILAHNHPSGCAEPSRADKEMTERIIKCCQFMDIRVLDHLIIGRGEYISFAEHGWI